MSLNDTYADRVLERLFQRVPAVPIGDSDRIVIFSDLHMGNGTRADDFRINSSMFQTVLLNHYYSKEYRLILNGDVEELQRFSHDAVAQRWGHVFAVIDRFRDSGRLYQIVGNHDERNGDIDKFPLYDRNAEKNNHLVPNARYFYDGLRLEYGTNTLFVLHGHQVLWRYEQFNRMIGYFLRYALTPLRIRNRTVAHDSRKRFITEKRVYEFARRRNILSIIGHTHRPLFESMSKVDTLRFQIENLCREYPGADRTRQQRIEQLIPELQHDLASAHTHQRAEGARRSLYNADLIVPCLFNSGCVLGKRGMTSLEIRDGRIALVYWFDASRDDTMPYRDTHGMEALPGTHYYRVVLEEDSLDYIFSRINLLE